MDCLPPSLVTRTDPFSRSFFSTSAPAASLSTPAARYVRLLAAGAPEAPESVSPLVMAALDTLLPWFAELRDRAQGGWTVAETTIGQLLRAMQGAQGGGKADRCLTERNSAAARPPYC